MKGLDIIHNLDGAERNAKANTIDQEPQNYESIENKDGGPIPDAHDSWWQKGTVGSSLWRPVHPAVCQTGEYKCNGW